MMDEVSKFTGPEGQKLIKEVCDAVEQFEQTYDGKDLTPLPELYRLAGNIFQRISPHLNNGKLSKAMKDVGIMTSIMEPTIKRWYLW